MRLHNKTRNAPTEKEFRSVSKPANRRGWIVWILLAAGLLATVLTAHYKELQTAAAAKHDFGLVCSDIREKIQNRFSAHEQVLLSGAAFFSDTHGVTRKEWHHFTESQRIHQKLPGVQGLGYALLIPREKLQQHILDVRAEGYPAYQVRPDDERDLYTSILYLEPFTNRNLRAFGYDMMSEPVRRTAMERARDQDAPALSGKVILVQETDEHIQAGTLMYVPVYRTGIPHETIDQRREAILGWVYSPYRMNDLMRGILGARDLANDRHIRLEIFDGDQALPEALLYDSQPPGTPQAKTLTPLISESGMISAGRQWTLRFTTTGGLAVVSNADNIRLVFFGGTSASLLLAGVLFHLLNTRFRARQMAWQLTTELRRNEAIQRKDRAFLQAAMNQSPSGIAIADAPSGNLRYVNDAGLLIRGSDHKTVVKGVGIDQYVAQWHLLDLDGRPLKADEVPLTRALVSGETCSRDFIIRRAEEDDRIVSTNAAPIRDEKGDIVAGIVVFTDITDRRHTEASLKESEEKYRLLINNTHDIIYTLTVDGVFTFVSPAWTVLLGHPDNQVVGRPFHQFVHRDDLEACRAFLKLVIDTDQRRDGVEYRVRHLDGSWRWHTSSAVPLRNKTGLVIGLQGIARDITEHKQLEEGRDISREVLQILNSPLRLPDSIQRILAVLKTRTGCDAVGMRLQEGDDYPYFAQDGFSKDFLLTENTLIERDKDGAICKDKDGHPFLDCTCGLVLSGKTDPSNPLFTRGGSFWVNDSFPLLDLPADQDPRIHPRTRCMRGGYASMALIPIRCQEAIVGLLHLNDRRKGSFTFERIQQLESIAEHIGEVLIRKRSEDALVYAWNTAEKANRAKSQFLSNMNHELRTPLNPILGFSELLAEAPNVTDEQRVWLRLIMQSSRHLWDVLGSVLDLSSIESDKITLQQEPFPLRQTVRDLAASIAPMAKKKGLRLDWNVAAELPDNLQSDAFRFRQILLNLLNNAIKFTSSGRIIMNVQDGAHSPLMRAPANGETALLFSIQDTGIGIPPDRKTAIFEAFTHADEKESVKYAGAGLGLTITRRLVELMGGRIWVESVPDKGSTFWFTIIVNLYTMPKEACQPDSAPDPSELCPLNVLIVDDDPTSLKMVEKVVQMAGHRVQTAADGQQAVSLTKTEAFDLVLMDIQMPIMNGVEATRLIREQDKLLGRKTYIVALTAYAMQDDRDLLLNVGMDDYLSKPAQMVRLRETLQTAQDRLPAARHRTGALKRNADLQPA